MKESRVVIIITIILLLMITIPLWIFFTRRKSVEKKQLEKANNIINRENKDEIEIVTKEELEVNENIIGIIEIPKLNLKAPIQEGTNQEILKIAVGHFEESSLWDGNVALASHNRSLYVHYFEHINELQIGDEIIYKTKFGIRKYSVYENKEIDSTDWSVIENTNDNILTLITCVKNSSDKRLCIRAKEHKEELKTNEQIDEPRGEPITSDTQDIKTSIKGEPDKLIEEQVEIVEKTKETLEIKEDKIEEQVELDFTKYDRYYAGLNGGYTCFNKNTEETQRLKQLIENAIQEFGYTNVKVVEDSSMNKDRYFTANKTNVQNAIYDSDGFTIHYYAETEYHLSVTGEEKVFQIRSYIEITGQ